MEEDQRLHQPFIPSTTTNPNPSSAVATVVAAPSSNSGIITRLLLFAFIGATSIWANHEASKGFDLTIVNEAVDTLPGKRFALFYESNDKATRLVLSASKFVENFLYPEDDHHPKKEVTHVTLRLARRNLTRTVVVHGGDGRHRFVLQLSPSVMADPYNYGQAMSSAVHEGVTRMWLWDGQGHAPPALVNGIVEYITSLAVHGGAQPVPGGGGGGCWKSRDRRGVAQFLSYCEGQRKGFIRRLNQAMKGGWHEQALDEALGIPVHILCSSYLSSSRSPYLSSSSASSGSSELNPTI